MRRFVHLLLVLVCVVFGLMVITAFDYVTNAKELSRYQEDQLVHGRIETWLWSQAVWERFPAWEAFRRVGVFYNPYAILLTIPVFLVLYVALRIKRQCSLLTMGVVCLGLGALPYGCGRLALWYNTSMVNAGPWISLMLLGVLYATVGCLFFALLGLMFMKVGEEKNAEGVKVKGKQAAAAIY